MISRTASAPIPALNRRPPRAPVPWRSSRPRSSSSPSVCIGLSDSISSRTFLSSSLAPWAWPDSCSRSLRSVSSTPAVRSATFCSTARSSSLSRCWSSALTRSVSAETILRRAAVASLPPLAPAATTTSPVGAKTIVSAASPVFSSASWASTAWAAVTTSSVRTVRCCSRSALVAASAAFSSSFCPVDVGAELVLELGELLAGLAAATLGLVLEGEQRALARLLVDVGDDVQGEVEDALEVPRADVEEDAEAARRALEVPDVADGAGQLDVAHPLTADLRAGDLDAALVADDALVADPLVLAAVALPVLRRTEDALVEQTVLLGLEGPVVDRLGLRHLTLRPLPDLVRAGERDADRVEVIDLEHGSPPRRRLARWRDAASGRARPVRPGLHPTGAMSDVSRQSSNPARLIPPRSGSM